MLLHVIIAAAFTLPPASEGLVQGKEAVLIWPADSNGALLDPADCEVHFLARQSQVDLRAPCGRWFVSPAPDRYEFWLEQGNRISPERTVIFYNGNVGRSGIRVVDRLVPAGLIRLAVPPKDDETFRVVAFGNPESEFERKVTAAEVVTPVRVPAGRTMCGIFDAAGNARALCRPVNVEEGKTITVKPTAPIGDHADLLIVLSKNEGTSGLRLQLVSKADTRQPDMFGESENRIVAAWYDVPVASAHVLVKSERGSAEELTVTLTSGRVTTKRSAYPSGSR